MKEHNDEVHFSRMLESIKPVGKRHSVIPIYVYLLLEMNTLINTVFLHTYINCP